MPDHFMNLVMCTELPSGSGDSSVMASLLEEREMGYPVVILQASSMDYNGYRRLRFQDFRKLSPHLWEQQTQH